jgi:hypothetical protein
VAWQYQADGGARFVQPTPQLAAADAEQLRVYVPPSGIGAIYLRYKLPADLRLVACQ